MNLCTNFGFSSTVRRQVHLPEKKGGGGENSSPHIVFSLLRTAIKKWEARRMCYHNSKTDLTTPPLILLQNPSHVYVGMVLKKYFGEKVIHFVSMSNECVFLPRGRTRHPLFFHFPLHILFSCLAGKREEAVDAMRIFFLSLSLLVTRAKE